MQFPRGGGETRRAILNRFPYAVYFRVAGDDIVVLAVHGGSIRGDGNPERDREVAS